jgi:hypothetical protein
MTQQMTFRKRNFVTAVTAMTLIGGTLGCSSAGKNTAVGAGVGAAAGAAIGAIVGHQSGDRGKGALIGAALGGGLGGLVGNRLDKQKKELEQIAETKRTENGLVSKLKSDILFDSGKAALKPTASQNLGKMAEIMKKYPEKRPDGKGLHRHHRVSRSKQDFVGRARGSCEKPIDRWRNTICYDFNCWNGAR